MCEGGTAKLRIPMTPSGDAPSMLAEEGYERRRAEEDREEDEAAMPRNKMKPRIPTKHFMADGLCER